jgi:2-methylisocitrate lyase-like PEP mutase family enzyme
VLPETHIFVDIDDGFGGEKAATNVVMRLEHVGASAVILEDQKRPKKCGHLDGKEIVPLPEYLKKLDAVLAARNNMLIVARTDATEFQEGITRAKAFARAGADIVLVEGVKEVHRIPELRAQLGDQVKILVNVIAGGKTPPITLSELSRMGVDIVNYSTPCLFSAHSAIDQTLRELRRTDGELEAVPAIGLNDNALFLSESMDIAQGRLKPVLEEDYEALQAV